jgi:hypothetical protein
MKHLEPFPLNTQKINENIFGDEIIEVSGDNWNQWKDKINEQEEYVSCEFYINDNEDTITIMWPRFRFLAGNDTTLKILFHLPLQRNKEELLEKLKELHGEKIIRFTQSLGNWDQILIHLGNIKCITKRAEKKL